MVSDYFLGIDVGGTKTHALIADASGQVVAFAEGGPGNWEDVGYDGLARTLTTVTECVLANAGLSKAQITGAGFGIAGYDWPSQLAPHRAAIEPLALAQANIAVVNDTLIGLMAGSTTGWGLALIAGTRANCCGWDQHRRVGRMTGYGLRFAEYAGGLEMVGRAVQAIALEWTCRGPATQLTSAFIKHTGAKGIEDLLEGLSLNRLEIDATAAPLIFQAANGDEVAREIVLWAARELGSLAIGVIRQLGFESQSFEIVQVGSLYKGSPLLVDTLHQTVQAVAPDARFLTLTAPPVVGAVLLAMEQRGINGYAMRDGLIESTWTLMSHTH